MYNPSFKLMPPSMRGIFSSKMKRRKKEGWRLTCPERSSKCVWEHPEPYLTLKSGLQGSRVTSRNRSTELIRILLVFWLLKYCGVAEAKLLWASLSPVATQGVRRPQVVFHCREWSCAMPLHGHLEFGDGEGGIGGILHKSYAMESFWNVCFICSHSVLSQIKSDLYLSHLFSIIFHYKFSV